MNHIKISQIISDYPAGARVELIKMDDNIHPIAPGTKGTVDFVDDTGQIHVIWENGVGLALVPEADEFKKIK